MSISAVITTRNEAATIGHLVRALVSANYPVYIVDDGSRDGTAEIARDAGARTVYETGGGAGIGSSLLYAWEMALADPYCAYVLQLDAGGSHQVEDAASLIECAQTAKPTPDVVLGSRFCPGANYLGTHGPWWRPWASRLMAFMCNTAHGDGHYTDWTSGYRLFSRSVIEYLLRREYHARMHGWQIEVLAYASAHGFIIDEVPITYIAGRSSFNRAIGYETMRTLWRVWSAIGWRKSRIEEDTYADPGT